MDHMNEYEIVDGVPFTKSKEVDWTTIKSDYEEALSNRARATEAKEKTIPELEATETFWDDRVNELKPLIDAMPE